MNSERNNSSMNPTNGDKTATTEKKDTPNEEKRDDRWIEELYRDIGGEG